ncbi:MAG: hypothetical protein ACKVI3_01405, partial [Verrucomicrobiia bacterium]
AIDSLKSMTGKGQNIAIANDPFVISIRRSDSIDSIHVAPAMFSNTLLRCFVFLRSMRRRGQSVVRAEAVGAGAG